MKKTIVVMALSALAMSAQAAVKTHRHSHSHKTSTTKTDARIDINTASEMQLQSVKGIGPKKAQAIVAYRKQHGEFKNVQQLVNIRGIGQGRLSKILNASPTIYVRH